MPSVELLTRRGGRRSSSLSRCRAEAGRDSLSVRNPLGRGFDHDREVHHGHVRDATSLLERMLTALCACLGRDAEAVRDELRVLEPLVRLTRHPVDRDGRKEQERDGHKQSPHHEYLVVVGTKQNLPIHGNKMRVECQSIPQSYPLLETRRHTITSPKGTTGC